MPIGENEGVLLLLSEEFSDELSDEISDDTEESEEPLSSLESVEGFVDGNDCVPEL